MRLQLMQLVRQEFPGFPGQAVLDIAVLFLEKLLRAGFSREGHQRPATFRTVVLAPHGDADHEVAAEGGAAE